MTELQRLLAACEEHLSRRRQCALATVVQVEGSAYRRSGARMLITDTGHLTGTISGGCLEGDARRRAMQVMQRDKPEIVVYDSLELDDDLEHGAQLGCQGLVHVLIEPLSQNQYKTLQLLRAATQQNASAVMVTILRSSSAETKIGAAFLATADQITGEGASAIQDTLILHARECLKQKLSEVKDIIVEGDNLTVFFEVIEPAPKLTIYGAGNDVQPLVKMAVNMGWMVTVVDGRSNLATLERFGAAQQVMCIKIGDLQKHHEQSDFTVLMSHNYLYDLEALKNLYHQSKVKYVGLLGPRKKKDRMLDDMRGEGLEITDDLTRRLFGPVGINIGAEAAEEIALAIMAELVAIRNGHPAGFLRDLDGPIHKTGHKTAYHAQ